MGILPHADLAAQIAGGVAGMMMSTSSLASSAASSRDVLRQSATPPIPHSSSKSKNIVWRLMN
jgi:hypothetical protein